METKWRKGEPARSEDDAASKRLRRVRDQAPESEIQHYPGRSFTGPGNQKPQAEWDDGQDAAGMGRAVKASTATFQRSRGDERFGDLGDNHARVSEPDDD